MKLLQLFGCALICLVAVGQNPNTAAFPTTVATDSDLLAAKRLSTSTLSTSINSSTLTVTVNDGTQFINYELIRIDGEELKICTVSGNTLTICSGGRGFNGTTAASHSSGATVNGVISSYHINQATAEIKAIQARLRDTTSGCSDAGANDSYACNLSPPITSYSAGTVYRFRANTANTGGATLDLNSVGPIALKKHSTSGLVDLADNDIGSGDWVLVTYNGTYMQVLGISGSGGVDCGSTGILVQTASGTYVCRTLVAGTGMTITNGNGVAGNPTPSVDTSVVLTKSASQGGGHLSGTTGGTSTAYTLALTPTLTTYTDNMVVTVKFHTANGSSPQLSIDGLEAKDLWQYRTDGLPIRLLSGGARTNGIYQLTYNPSLSDVSSGGFMVNSTRMIDAGTGFSVTCTGTSCQGFADVGFGGLTTGTNSTAAMELASGASWVANSATRTAPNKSGTSLPGTCTVGDSYQKTDATPASSQHYLCTSANTWTAQGGNSPTFDAISTGTNTTATTTWGAGSSLVANAATRTAPNKSGTSLPGTCTVGDSYQKTDATPASSQHYLCTSTNTWTAQGGGSTPNSLFDSFTNVAATTCNSSNNGQIALLTASNYSSARCNGTSWEYIVAGYGVKASVPAAADYTLVTSMSGTKDSSTGGGIYYHQDTTAGGGGNYVYGALLKSLPSTPYTITAHIRQFIQTASSAFNFVGCGLGWADGTATTNKIHIGFFMGSGYTYHKWAIAVRHADSFSDASGAWDVDGSTYPGWGTPMLEWFRLSDTGSTKKIQISTNGVDWRDVYSASSSTNFTPSHYGPMCYQGSQPAMWQVTIDSISEQ